MSRSQTSLLNGLHARWWNARPSSLPPYSSSRSFFCFFCLLSLSVPRSSHRPPYFFSIFFTLRPGKRRGEETARNYSTTLGASSAVARNLLSQFANRAPGPWIVHLHFTIFRSEINTASSAPHRNVPFVCTYTILLPLFLFLSVSKNARISFRQPGPPTQKTVDVLAKYWGTWKLMRDRLSSDRSIDHDWRVSWLVIK